MPLSFARKGPHVTDKNHNNSHCPAWLGGHARGGPLKDVRHANTASTVLVLWEEGSFSRYSHRPFPCWPWGLPVASILSTWLRVGVSEGPQRLGAPRTLTGSSHCAGIGHSWQGVWLPVAGAMIWGFRALSDWGAQNLDRFRPLLEGSRPLLGGGFWPLSGSAKQVPYSETGEWLRKVEGFQQPPLPFVCRTRAPRTLARPLSAGAPQTTPPPDGPVTEGHA